MEPSTWTSGFWPLWPWVLRAWSTARVPSYMTVKRACPKLVLPETHSQAKTHSRATCWKWNCPASPEGIQGTGGQGQQALEHSMVNLHFLVGIHQLKLQVLTRTSQDFTNVDTFSYKNYITVTIFSLFRFLLTKFLWNTPFLQRQCNVRGLDHPGRDSKSPK